MRKPIRFWFAFHSLLFRFPKKTLATTPLLHYSNYRTYVLLSGCPGREIA